MAEGHLEVLGGKDPLAELEPGEIDQQRDWEHERRDGRGLGRDHQSPGRHRGEGGADHAGGVLRGDRSHGERSEQGGGDDDPE
ncbi:MAG: hypothetical protein ACLP22_06375 [Solirubrobacteraceae bacterium]